MLKEYGRMFRSLTFLSFSSEQVWQVNSASSVFTNHIATRQQVGFNVQDVGVIGCPGPSLVHGMKKSMLRSRWVAALGRRSLETTMLPA